jgi:bifunctional non-homologous end joining protein LigD
LIFSAAAISAMVARVPFSSISRQRCLPSPAEKPPIGSNWIHEIKHDGYRLMARRDPAGVRLFTKNAHDWTDRYPSVLAAVNHLPARSCLIDGEVVACDENGLAIFDRLRHGPRRKSYAALGAFDLLELDGADLRRKPIEERKRRLAELLRAARPGLQLNAHLDEPGDVVFRHACKMGLEGIVSKRRGSHYQSGRSPHWIKSKNLAAPAVLREAEEDWGRP